MTLFKNVWFRYKAYRVRISCFLQLTHSSPQKHLCNLLGAQGFRVWNPFHSVWLAKDCPERSETQFLCLAEARTWKPGSLDLKVWSCWASSSPGQLELCSLANCPGVMDPGFSFHGEFHVFDCFLAQFWNICCPESHGRQNGGNKVFLNSLCLTTVLWKLTHS